MKIDITEEQILDHLIKQFDLDGLGQEAEIRITEALTKRLEAKADAMARAAAEAAIDRRLSEAIDVGFIETNRWGEPVNGARKTFTEFLAGRIQVYLDEMVNPKTGTRGPYSGDNTATRFQWLAQTAVHDAINRTVGDKVRAAVEEQVGAISDSIGGFVSAAVKQALTVKSGR